MLLITLNKDKVAKIQATKCKQNCVLRTKHAENKAQDIINYEVLICQQISKTTSEQHK